MSAGSVWTALVFGLVVQFGVIYGAIRMALRDERLAVTKPARMVAAQSRLDSRP